MQRTPSQQRESTQTTRVVDLGAGDDPDPRADETADLHYDGADHQFDLREQWPFDDGSIDGLVARHSLEHIAQRDLPYVFEEAARVLKTDGWFEVRVPVGSDDDTDPTHRSEWAWRTIDLYTDPERHWVPTIPFDVIEKDLEVWMVNPLRVLTPLVRAGSKYWPHEGWYELPGATGELTILLEVSE